MPSLDGYIAPPITPGLNTIYIAKIKYNLLMEEYADTNIRKVIHDPPWFTQSSAYFDGGKGSRDSLSLNGQGYTVQPNIQLVSYELHSGTFHTDGSPNPIRWIKNGAVGTYDFTANIGDAMISSPEFGATIGRSDALTITWPKASEENVFCKIVVNGKPPGESPSGTKFSHIETEVFGNTGTYTFPAGALAGFTENWATIMVVQGTYRTAIIDGESYLFSAYTQAFSDVRLAP